MSWNGYPKRFRNSVIKRIETNRSRSRLTDNDYRKKTWLQSGQPQNNKIGEKLVASLIKKLKRFFKANVKIAVKYKTKKLSVLSK